MTNENELSTRSISNPTYVIPEWGTRFGSIQHPEDWPVLDPNKVSALMTEETDPQFNDWLSGESIAAGTNANVTADNGIAIGANSSVGIGVAIGLSSSALAGTAIGRYAYTTSGTSIGISANSHPGAVAIGSRSNANTLRLLVYQLNESGTSIGYQSHSFDSVAIGSTTSANFRKTIAIGYNAIANSLSAIQLGKGTNSTQKTFQVWDYQLLDSNGNVPEDRVSAIGYIKAEDVPLSVSQLINDSGYITSSYVSLSSVEKSSTLVLTEEQKAALVQASGMPAEAFGDFVVSVRTSDGMGYIGPIDFFSAVQNENGDWVFVGGMPSLNVLGWVANSTVIQGSEIHTILSVDKVSVDIAIKDELAGYLPLNGGGVVTGNVAIQNLDGDSLFSLNNYGKVTIGAGASIDPDAQYGVAIGANAYAAEGGIAINASAAFGISANNYDIAIGDSVVSGETGSIQLGYSNNSSDALFRVWKYPTLDGNGDIPYGRLSAAAGEIRNVFPITSTTDASISLTKNTYTYRVTDSNNTGIFPTLVAPTDITQTGDYYFIFEIEWKTAASLVSYPTQYDWINYPEIQTDGQQHTYYIAGRWDSGGSGAAAFTLNCWRTK